MKIKTMLTVVFLLLLPIKVPWAHGFPIEIEFERDTLLSSGYHPGTVKWMLEQKYDTTLNWPTRMREYASAKVTPCPTVFRIEIVGWDVDTTLYNVSGYLEYENKDEYDPTRLRILHRKRVQGYYQIDSTAILDTIPVYDTTVYVGGE